MKNIILIISLFLILGCSNDRDKIIGLWEINAITVGKSFPLSKGTFEFEEDSIVLIKMGENINKMKWNLKNDTITIDGKRYHYILKNNRLKMTYKGRLEMYVELIRK